MKSLIKSSLFIGMSLVLALLTERRFRSQSEEKSELEQLANQNLAADPEKSVPSHPAHVATRLPPGAHSARILAEIAARPVPAATVIFSGRLMRKGERLILREIAGALYPLDSAGKASSYEGEDVRVTGKLDLSTRMLHVDAIESAVL